MDIHWANLSDSKKYKSELSFTSSQLFSVGEYVKTKGVTNLISNDFTLATKIFAYSGELVLPARTITAVDYINLNPKNYKFGIKFDQSTNFLWQYSDERDQSYKRVVGLVGDKLDDNNPEDDEVLGLFSNYDINYALLYNGKKYDNKSNTYFFQKISEKKNKIYDNSRHSIYSL